MEEFDINKLKEGIKVTKGGTSHIEVFKFLDRKHPKFKLPISWKPTVLICFTDLYTEFPDNTPPYKVYWVGYEKNLSPQKPPFGTVITIPDNGGGRK